MSIAASVCSKTVSVENTQFNHRVFSTDQMRVSRRMCPETVIGHRSAPPPGAEHPTATVSVGTSRVIWEQGEETGNATMALTYAASTPHAPAVSTTTSKPVVLSAAQAGRGGDPNSKLLTSPTPVLTAGARGDTQRVNAKTQAARVPSGSIETESRTAQGSGIGERTTVKVIITERDGEGDGGAIPQRKDRWIRQPKRLINPIFRGKALATSTEDKQHLASPWARGIDDAATPPRAAQCREVSHTSKQKRDTGSVVYTRYITDNTCSCCSYVYMLYRTEISGVASGRCATDKWKEGTR